MHLNNGTDHRHSKSCCDQSSPARRTISWCDCVFAERGGINLITHSPLGAWLRFWMYSFANDIYWPFYEHFQSLQWRHDGLDSVLNHQPHYCLLSRLFGRRPKKTSKLRVTGLYAGNSPGTGEFHAEMASIAETVSIWWRHHGSIAFRWVAQDPADDKSTLVQIMAWCCQV